MSAWVSRGESPASREGNKYKNLPWEGDADPRRWPWWPEVRYQGERRRDVFTEAMRMQEEHDPSCAATQVIGRTLGVTPREMGLR